MRRTRRAMSQINVVPYIDVMLVLLVIFMVAAPMIQPAVVNLPRVDNADKQVSAVPLRVDIKGEHIYQLSDKGHDTHYHTEADLIAAITHILGQHSERPVVIAADKAVRYEWVMETMSALKRAQIVRVGLLVQPK